MQFRAISCFYRNIINFIFLLVNSFFKINAFYAKIAQKRYDFFHCTSLQFVEKVCIYKNRANSQSLSPNPFPQERGYITGATAPRPCRGLRPCDPIFNIYKRFFDSLKRGTIFHRTSLQNQFICSRHHRD